MSRLGFWIAVASTAVALAATAAGAVAELMRAIADG